MAVLLKVFVAFLALIYSSSASTPKPPAKCTKPNQIYSEFGNHPCQDTCENPKLSSNCLYPEGNYPGCICKDGFLKQSGDCVPARNCFDCESKANEYYSDCGNHPCQNTCQFPGRLSACSYAAGVCFPGCLCDEGYFRDYDDQCVLKEECPPPCPRGERYLECGTACPITCDNKDNPPTVCTKNCVSGCFCKDGWVRNVDSGDCIPAEGCPPKCPNPNEIYYGCKPCRYTCENSTFACGDNCVEGCECKEGYIRQNNINDTCVLIESCPKCPSNEEYKSCGTACPITCKNKDNPPKICTKNCVEGCFCKKGYVRDESSKKCVLPKNCPLDSKPPKCNKNEVWLKKCAKYQDTCQESFDPELGFKPGCCCKNGYVREYKGGKCIRRCECNYESSESDEYWD